MTPIASYIMSFVLFATISIQGYFITSDNLDNLYVITKDNSLVKFDSSGKKLFAYNSKKYGQLKYADVTNPFKILVYYPDFTTAIVLDNTLSELSVVNLKQAGIVQPACICTSSDNNIWVYDAQEFKLKKLNQNQDVLVESADLLTTTQQAVEPTMMIERDNFIFLNDPKKGIFVFDNYGAYSSQIPVTGITDFQAFNKKLFYYKDHAIQLYNIQTLETVANPMPDTTGVMQIRIEKNRLFLLKENEVILYRY